MKESLIKLLELPAEATDEQIVAAVSQLVEESKNVSADAAFERAIAKKISDSHGALNRAQAIIALENQAAADATAKKQKPVRK